MLQLPPGRRNSVVPSCRVTFIAMAVMVVWALTGGGDFWPRWVWFAFATSLSLHSCLLHIHGEVVPHLDRAADKKLDRADTVRVYKMGLTIWAAIVVTLIWALSGFQSMWPAWVWFGMALSLYTSLGASQLTLVPMAACPLVVRGISCPCVL